MEHAGPIAFLLILVFPVAVLLEMAGLALPSGFWIEVTIVTTVFVASVLALPFAVVGLRTSNRVIAATALLVGAIEAAWLYLAKFHPWVERSFGL